MKDPKPIKQNSSEGPFENPAVADLFFLTEDTPLARIRFLIDFDDPRAVAMPWHKNYEEKIDRPCLKQFSMECEDCASTNKKTRNNEDIYVWPVWDYEAQRVRLVAGRENSFTLVGKLLEYYEERGSILGRDFVVKRVKDESTKFPKLTLVPEDPSEFQFADDAYIPSADTSLKTMILACDAELAAELGISTDERLGVLAEAAGKGGKAGKASAPATTNAPSFRKRFNADHADAT